MADDDLGMLTDDQIDYGSMPEDALRKFVSGDDLFVATSALVELSLRRSKYAAPLAFDILSNAKGDRYFQSTALSVLYRMDHVKALNYIREKLDTMSPYQLNAVVEILLDNEPDFKTASNLPLVRRVFRRLGQLEGQTGDLNQELINDFQERFKGSSTE